MTQNANEQKTTRTFTKEELLHGLGLPHDVPEGGEVISDTIVDTTRWSTIRELTFRLPEQPKGEAWQVGYSVGSTEQQEEGPWEYEDTVTAKLVRKTRRMVDVWEPVEATNG